MLRIHRFIVVLVFIFMGVMGVSAQTPLLTATTNTDTLMFSGPGNLACYSKVKNVAINTEVTLLAGLCTS